MKYLTYCGMLIVHYLSLFVDVSISGAQTTNNVVVRQCVQDGGYCQTAWDCCSNRCLSFSYKCVRGPPSSVYAPYQPSAPVESPTLIAVDTLEELVDRFGNDDDKTSAQPPSPATTSTSATKPTTIATSTISSTSTSSSTGNSQCIEIGYACADSSQCCSNDCLHYNDAHICIQKRIPTTVTTTTTVSPNGQCLTIGQKCYRNEECCTQRCHGFLHQCVT